MNKQHMNFDIVFTIMHILLQKECWQICKFYATYTTLSCPVHNKTAPFPRLDIILYIFAWFWKILSHKHINFEIKPISIHRTGILILFFIYILGYRTNQHISLCEHCRKFTVKFKRCLHIRAMALSILCEDCNFVELTMTLHHPCAACLVLLELVEILLGAGSLQLLASPGHCPWALCYCCILLPVVTWPDQLSLAEDAGQLHQSMCHFSVLCNPQLTT